MKSINVTVSNRGYIVLPASLRKEMNIKKVRKSCCTGKKIKLFYSRYLLSLKN